MMVGRRLAFGAGCAFLVQGIAVPTVSHASTALHQNMANDPGITTQFTPPAALFAGLPQTIAVKITNTGTAIPSAYVSVAIGNKGAESTPPTIDHFDAATQTWRTLSIAASTVSGPRLGTVAYRLPIPVGASTDSLRITPGANEMGDTIVLGAAYSANPITQDPTPTTNVAVARPVVTSDVQNFAVTVGGPPQQVVDTFVNTAPVATGPMALNVEIGLFAADPLGGAQQPTPANVPVADIRAEWLNAATGQMQVLPVKAPTTPGFPYTAAIPTSAGLAPSAQQNVTVRFSLLKGTPVAAVKGTLAISAVQFPSVAAAFTVTPAAAPPPATPTPTRPSAPASSATPSKPVTPSSASSTPATSQAPSNTPTDATTSDTPTAPVPSDLSSPSASPSASDSDIPAGVAASADGSGDGSGSTLPIILGAIALLAVAGGCLTVWWRKYR